MPKVNFFKYAVNGNNFILLDELDNIEILEKQKTLFSKYVGNTATGLGCDSLIVLQHYNPQVLNEIYPHQPIQTCSPKPRFIMRVYEKDLESNMCGNGLIALGYHLAIQRGIHHAIVGTEAPTGQIVPRMVSVTTGDKLKATLGPASLPPIDFVVPTVGTHHVPAKIAYRLKPFTFPILMEGELHDIIFDHCYITFTGEPHLVIFRSELLKNSTQTYLYQQLFNTLFDPTMSNAALAKSTLLINQIGEKFNALRDYFPKGVNVNFAMQFENGKIAHRCFERGIDNETYACGTGATAVAVLANALGLTDSNHIRILPWRARFELLYQDAEITVNREESNYCLTTKAMLLAQGKYHYTDVMQNQSEAGKKMNLLPALDLVINS